MEKLLMDYPVLMKKISRIYLQPGSLFRLEGVPCEYGSGVIVGNILLMFTGLIQRDHNRTEDYIHCIPLVFYGKDKESLSELYKGQDVWVQISDLQDQAPYDQMFPKYETGYWN